MITIVDDVRRIQLSDYELVPGLEPILAEVRHEARQAAKLLGKRRVWLLSEEVVAGAAAEMAPSLVGLLRACDIDARWVRYQPDNPRLAALGRQLRRLILGDPDTPTSFGEDDDELYTDSGDRAAAALLPEIGRHDLILVHGVGAATVGAAIKRRRRVTALWRCVVGYDDRTPATRAAWHFLKRHLTLYNRGLFNCAEYIPQYFTNRASLVPPAIDPLADKNRPLSLQRVVGTLTSAGLCHSDQPTLARTLAAPAQRVAPNGRLVAAGELGLLYRPIVAQISRWDRLKGMVPLLEGFARLKRDLATGQLGRLGEREQRRVEIARLVLAGPEPDAFGADTDMRAAFDELVATYRGLDEEVAADICILALPTSDPEAHALTVNALQRASTVVAQNSLREGFGLTIAEAAWKGVPVLGSATSGIRYQIRHEIDGLLCEDPEDPEVLARSLLAILSDEAGRRRYAASAQRRVLSEFLITGQLRRFLRLFTELA